MDSNELFRFTYFPEQEYTRVILLVSVLDYLWSELGFFFGEIRFYPYLLRLPMAYSRFRIWPTLLVSLSF